MRAMRYQMLPVAALLQLLLLVLVDAAPENQTSTEKGASVLLRNRHINTLLEPSEYLGDVPRGISLSSFIPWFLKAEEPRAFYILKTHAALLPPRLREIGRQLGDELDHYLPHHSWLVYVDRASIATAQTWPDVEWIGRLQAADKIEADTESRVRSAFKQRAEAVLLAAVHESVATPQLLENWSSKISTDLHLDEHQFRLSFGHKSRVHLSFDDIDLTSQLLEWLSKQDECLRVFALSVVSTLNKWSRGIVQSGVSVPDYSDNSPLLSSRHQLDGTGQVIGIGDSGLNVSNLFFSDESVPVPFRKYSTKVPTDSFDTRHRKIVQYVEFADAVDEAGHGTHVCGSIAGTPINLDDPVIKEFSGMAPNSKLAFFDMGIGNSNDIRAPTDLETLFNWAYAAGARIHSNSWGSFDNAYTEDCVDLDKFSWSHKDFLPVFAAGNDGSKGVGSLNAPASAKNALAVGASINCRESFVELFCSDGYAVPDVGTDYCWFAEGPKHTNFDKNSMAGFSSMGPARDGRIKPDIVAPGLFIYSTKRSAPSSIRRPSEILGFRSGTSMATPIVAGNLALVRQYFMEGFYPTGERNSEHGFSPSGALMKAIAINSAVELDGSRDVRQSASDEYTFEPVKGSPSMDQGFGRMQLDQVLKFANQTTFDLLIAGVDTNTPQPIQSDPLLGSSGAAHDYQICILGSSVLYPPKLTLVWTDPPALALSDVALVNNLDLEVSLIGFNNTIFDKPVRFFPNGGDSADDLNNVEEVRLPSALAYEQYSVRVVASNLPRASQPYSLVMRGQIRSAPPGQPCDFQGTNVQFSDGTLAPKPSGIYAEESPWSSWLQRNSITLGAVFSVVVLTMFGFVWNRRRRSRLASKASHNRVVLASVPNL